MAFKLTVDQAEEVKEKFNLLTDEQKSTFKKSFPKLDDKQKKKFVNKLISTDIRKVQESSFNSSARSASEHLKEATKNNKRVAEVEKDIETRVDLFNLAKQGVLNHVRDTATRFKTDPLKLVSDLVGHNEFQRLKTTGEGVSAVLPAAGGEFQRTEAMIANSLMQIQKDPALLQTLPKMFRGDGLEKSDLKNLVGYYGRVGDAAFRGLTGERLGQMGDVFKIAGFPDWMASLAGLTTMARTPNMTFSKMAEAAKKQGVTDEGVALLKFFKNRANKVGRNFMEDLILQFQKISPTLSRHMLGRDEAKFFTKSSVKEGFKKVPSNTTINGRRMGYRDNDALLEFGRELKGKIISIRGDLGKAVGEANKTLVDKPITKEGSELVKASLNDMLDESGLLGVSLKEAAEDAILKTDQAALRLIKLRSGVAKNTLPDGRIKADGVVKIIDEIDDVVKFAKEGQSTVRSSPDSVLMRARGNMKKVLHGQFKNKREADEAFSEFASIDESLKAIRDDTKSPRFLAGVFDDNPAKAFERQQFEKLIKRTGDKTKALDIVTAQTFGNKTFQGIKTGVIGVGLDSVDSNPTQASRFAKMATALTLSTPRKMLAATKTAERMGRTIEKSILALANTRNLNAATVSVVRDNVAQRIKKHMEDSNNE